MREPSAVLVPQMNVNDDQAIIVAWHLPSGERVQARQLIATLETTKATFDVHADRDGFLIYEHEVRSLVAVGSPLAWINDEPKLPARATAAAANGSAPSATEPDSRFTRKALKRMRELGLAASDFAQPGRIDVAEVERVAATPRAAAPTATALSANELWEPLEQTPSKVMEAARLSEVYRSVVPSLVTMPLACDRVKQTLQALAATIGPVSLLELLVRETAGVLADFPELNAFVAQGKAWHYRDIAIGFAVNAGGRGLRVPVVRGAQGLPQLEVCRAIRDLTLRYFRDELSMGDVAGGTFTITDLSGHGVTYFVPVLNDRQSAILGLCAPEPSGATQNLVLAFDHRLSDGMRAAEFLGALSERLYKE